MSVWICSANSGFHLSLRMWRILDNTAWISLSARFILKRTTRAMRSCLGISARWTRRGMFRLGTGMYILWKRIRWTTLMQRWATWLNKMKYRSLIKWRGYSLQERKTIRLDIRRTAASAIARMTFTLWSRTGLTFRLIHPGLTAILIQSAAWIQRIT